MTEPPIARAHGPVPDDVYADDLVGVSVTLHSVSDAAAQMAEALGDSRLLAESDGCCGDIDAAHEHGRELGWTNALVWATELMTGRY